MTRRLTTLARPLARPPLAGPHTTTRTGRTTHRLGPRDRTRRGTTFAARDDFFAVCVALPTAPAARTYTHRPKYRTQQLGRLRVEIMSLKKENLQLRQELKEAKKALDGVKCELV